MHILCDLCNHEYENRDGYVLIQKDKNGQMVCMDCAFERWSIETKQCESCVHYRDGITECTSCRNSSNWRENANLS